jgi:riboflavin synthase
MFTGIIENTARVSDIRAGKDYMLLELKSDAFKSDAKTGDSISVNGVCLTVRELRGSAAVFDVVSRTLDDSALSGLKSGHTVNIEKSLKIGDRVSGHFVYGHIDCVGCIRNIKRSEKRSVFEIDYPREYSSYVIAKGSVAVDGISLTVADAREGVFSVYAIPHTYEKTVLKDRTEGDKVNLEFDMIAKYARNKSAAGKSEVDENLLREYGYI